VIKTLFKLAFDLVFRYWNPKYYLTEEQLRQMGVPTPGFSNPSASVFQPHRHHHRR
jgi:hypothetical protein